ncbi:hypothetical protein JCM9279_004942 [Rhodotorula babjevae]
MPRSEPVTTFSAGTPAPLSLPSAPALATLLTSSPHPTNLLANLLDQAAPPTEQAVELLLATVADLSTVISTATIPLRAIQEVAFDRSTTATDSANKVLWQGVLDAVDTVREATSSTLGKDSLARVLSSMRTIRTTLGLEATAAIYSGCAALPLARQTWSGLAGMAARAEQLAPTAGFECSAVELYQVAVDVVGESEGAGWKSSAVYTSAKGQAAINEALARLSAADAEHRRRRDAKRARLGRPPSTSSTTEQQEPAAGFPHAEQPHASSSASPPFLPPAPLGPTATTSSMPPPPARLTRSSASRASGATATAAPPTYPSSTPLARPRRPGGQRKILQDESPPPPPPPPPALPLPRPPLPAAITTSAVDEAAPRGTPPPTASPPPSDGDGSSSDVAMSSSSSSSSSLSSPTASSPSVASPSVTSPSAPSSCARSDLQAASRAGEGQDSSSDGMLGSGAEWSTGDWSEEEVRAAQDFAAAAGGGAHGSLMGALHLVGRLRIDLVALDKANETLTRLRPGSSRRSPTPFLPTATGVPVLRQVARALSPELEEGDGENEEADALGVVELATLLQRRL